MILTKYSGLIKPTKLLLLQIDHERNRKLH